MFFRCGAELAAASDLEQWLGSQAWLLQKAIFLIEVSAGPHARLSRRANAQGLFSLKVGRAWGQELGSETSCRLLDERVA